MKGLSKKEIEILILLVKDFSGDYNANNLSKAIDITPRGALKALKNLQKKKLITGKNMGKAVFYKANLEDYYAFRTVETLLIEEAREKAGRWLSEFGSLFAHVEILLIFGSAIRSKKANDIDLLLVFKKEKSMISKLISERRAISAKAIHIVKQTPADLYNNLKKNDKVLLNIIKNSYVLHGYDKLLEVIKNAARI